MGSCSVRKNLLHTPDVNKSVSIFIRPLERMNWPPAFCRRAVLREGKSDSGKSENTFRAGVGESALHHIQSFESRFEKCPLCNFGAAACGRTAPLRAAVYLNPQPEPGGLVAAHYFECTFVR